MNEHNARNPAVWVRVREALNEVSMTLPANPVRGHLISLGVPAPALPTVSRQRVCVLTNLTKAFT
jgi:hypothetical protein